MTEPIRPTSQLPQLFTPQSPDTVRPDKSNPSAAHALQDEPLSTAATQLVDSSLQLREYVASRIEFDLAVRANSGETVEGMTGAIWVPQSAYGDSKPGRDQQMALGGTYFEYQIVANNPDSTLNAQISVSDHYFWSPADAERASQCLHQRGAELVSAGKATEFYQFAEGMLIIANPNVAEPMLPFDPPRTADDD